jgi:uncharacterized protein involved in outer membrane biogenesis
LEPGEIREIEEYREREPRPVLWFGLAGAVVVVGLVIGFLFWTLNSGSLKPRLIEAVQRATGRTLTISGQTRFELSLSPTVSMENVALANPPGFSRANMITVARVEVGLELLPLLEHQLEVDHVTLVQPDVLLETNASGRRNWLFSREKPPQASGSAPVPAVADAPADPEARQRLAVWFSNVSIADGRVGWLDGKSGQHHEAQVTQLTLEAPQGDAAQLTGAVVYAGRTINLTGRAEPTELDDSGPGSGPWPVSLKLETGDANLTVDGQIEHPAEARGYSLTIEADAPDPSFFAPWFPGLPLASLKSLTAHAEVSDIGGTAPTLSTAQIKVGSVDAGMLGDGAKLENVTIGAKGDAPISVSAAITRDGFDSGITGTIGDLHWLNAGGTGPVAVDLEWNAAAARASIKGTVKAPAQMAGFDLDVAADVPKPVQIMNDAPPDLRSVLFHTRLTDAPGPVPFSLTSNAGDLSGALSVSRLSGAPGAAFGVEGEVSSQRLDLDMLLARSPGGTSTPPASTAPAPASGSAAAGDKLLIPDTKLPFGLLRAIDANIKLGFADVRFDGADIRKIDSVAAIKDGQLRVDPFTIAATDQRMSATLLADAAKTPPVVHLTVDAPALAVQPLLAALGLFRRI